MIWAIIAAVAAGVAGFFIGADVGYSAGLRDLWTESERLRADFEAMHREVAEGMRRKAGEAPASK